MQKMDTKKVKVLSELIEHSATVSKLLVTSEMALNDGDLNTSQKKNIEAQNLLKTMVKDIFAEAQDVLVVKSEGTDDYDIPCTMELIKMLTMLSQNTANLIGILCDGDGGGIADIIAKKIIININTIVEIHNSIFNN